MTTPVAILISDVHYSLKTMGLADIAFRTAIDKAAELQIPLIDCGDLTNDKAILRAEVVNMLIGTMRYAKLKEVDVVLLVGNHSLINEKATEHALNFLKPYASVIDIPMSLWEFNFIPYQNDSNKFLEAINEYPKGSIVIGHQGTIGGQLGDYVKDSSAINPDDVLDWKVFLGHYHAHYILKSTVSIGNPYTLTFGESGDGPKGFLILSSDGTFTREILNLRKHVKMTAEMRDGVVILPTTEDGYSSDDLVWLRISGPYSELQKLDKQEIGQRLGLTSFKLDLIPTDSTPLEIPVENLSAAEVFDRLIDNTSESDEQKTKLKATWRELI